MGESKNSTTKKVLRTQRRTMGWTIFLCNLSALLLLACFWLLWHIQSYAGGWEYLDNLHLTYLDIRLTQPVLSIWLTMMANGMEQAWWDVTG